MITGRNASTGPALPRLEQVRAPAPLEDRDDHAERRAGGQHVHHRRGQRDQHAAERDHQQEAAERDDRRRGTAAACRSGPRRSRRRSRSCRRRRPGSVVPFSAAGMTSSRSWSISSVVSSSCGDGASGRPGDADRRRRAWPAAACTAATPGVAATAVTRAVSACAVAGVCELGHQLQRAVEAGTEAVGEQVVGLAGGRAGRVVAGVGGAQAQRQVGIDSSAMTISATDG